MSKHWNPEQLQAIELRQKNILVSASAGSGKTGVLVQRLSDLVTKDHIGLDEILAMTFSEDAANEMKKRLSGEISTLVQNETDPSMKAFLSQQLSKLPSSHISTIHSFCYSIIKENYYLLGLSLDRVSHLCEPSTQTIFQNQALQIVLETQQKQCDDSFVRLCSLLSSRPEDMHSLEDTILKVANMANSQANPQAWLTLAKQNYQVESFSSSQVYQVFKDYWHSQIIMYLQAFYDIETLFYEHWPNEEKRFATFMKKKEQANLIQPNASFHEVRFQVMACARLPLPTSPDASNENYKQYREIIQKIEDLFLSVPESETMASMIQSIQPLVEKLIECVEQFFEEYEAIKSKEACIDFSDMEHFALEILHQFPEVQNRYRQQFKQIMVDEFQDSNDVQDELVHLICQPNNVFRVGDVKQSIYGFRHALPSIMQSYKEKEDHLNTVIRFNKNYRSDATIVEFNNVLYEILMNIDGFNSLPFKQEDLSAIGMDSQKENNSPIVFHALNPETIRTYEDERIKKDEYKASYIAHLVLEQKRLGKYDFKDMAVLVRSNAKMEILKQTFERLNIPYYMNQKTGFYSSRSIQILMSTLNCMIHPHDDIDFVAMLTSSYFNFTSEQLAQLALQREKKESYYSVCSRVMPKLLDYFDQLRFSKLSLSEMITELFKWNNFYDSCSLQDQTNCDLFFQLAIDHETNVSLQIDSFLTKLKQTSTEETAQTSTIGKGENVVRFMSIHNSKGLEFPVVFLWSTSLMSKKEASDFVICDNELGLGLKFMDESTRQVLPTYQRLAIEHKQNRDEIEEEIRILYVATTRAKKEMHIVDFLNPKLDIEHSINYSKINDRKGTTSWILQSLASQGYDHLFQIQHVDVMWQNMALQKPQTQPSQVLRYPKTNLITYVSPSRKEHTHFEARPLNLNLKDLTQKGKTLHKLVELLPLSEWNEELIYQTAQKYQLQVTSSMIHQLLVLNQNPLFQTCLKQQVYREYPFIVQTEKEVLHGFMDFLAIEDKITLIDFKSDTRITEQDLLERYTSQIKAYEIALAQLFPLKQVVSYLYSFELNEFILVK